MTHTHINKYEEFSQIDSEYNKKFRYRTKPGASTACMFKKKFDSEEQAMKRAEELKNIVKFRCYKCPHCKSYHLTKDKKNTKKEGVKVPRSEIARRPGPKVFPALKQLVRLAKDVEWPTKVQIEDQ